MGKCANISTYMRRPLLIYDFATAPLWISLYMRKIWFSFLSVYGPIIIVLTSFGPVSRFESILEVWTNEQVRLDPGTNEKVWDQFRTNEQGSFYSRTRQHVCCKIHPFFRLSIIRCLFALLLTPILFSVWTPYSILISFLLLFSTFFFSR